MNNGFFPSYFGHHHGLGGHGPPPPVPPVMDPALSPWGAAANPHFAAAAMAAAAAEHLRSNPVAAAAAFHHHLHHNPFYPPLSQASQVSSGLGGQSRTSSLLPPHLASLGTASGAANSLVPPTPQSVPEDKSDKRSIISNSGKAPSSAAAAASTAVSATCWRPASSSVGTSSSTLSDQIQNTTSSHSMFNTGLPPLDRQGLFPSHGSILDPLQQTPYQTAKKPVEKPKVLTVNLTSESDEEVLVDDFDGQCCRTYPDNHSRIIKWRAQRAEKAKKPTTTVVSTSSTPTTTTIKPSSRSGTKSKESSSSGIPVGIAIGRQRQPGSGTVPTWPLASPTGCSASSAGSAGSSAGPAPPMQWMPPPPHQQQHHIPGPAGPIPMGYQLAKDPLTGQILLIPTDPSQAASAGHSWMHQPPTNRYEPYGLDSRIPPGVMQSHYHQLYLQQQQHLRYYQQHMNLPPRYPPLQPPPAPQPSQQLQSPKPRRLEPETITVSDDDDDDEQVEAPRKETKSNETKAAEEQPMDLVADKVQDLSVKIKEEPIDQDDLKNLIAESLLELSKHVEEDQSHEEFQAFEELLQGIEMHENAQNGLDMICALTAGEEDFKYTCSHSLMTSKLDVLCCVTNRDKLESDAYVDPLFVLKQSWNLHEYHTSTSAQDIQTFIQNKTQYFKKLAEVPEGCFLDDKEPPSLTKVLKKIKNTEFMSELEVQLRQQLMQLQDDYRDKQSQLNRLKSPRKKFKRKNRKLKPVKKTPSKKVLNKSRRNSQSPALPSTSTLMPRLDPAATPVSSPSLPAVATNPECWKQSSQAMLKPPKLTASTSAKRSVTNLSTINARFMKGKANPFANLMKLAASPSTSQPTTGNNSPVKNLPDIDENIEQVEHSLNEESSASETDEYTFDDDKDQGFSPGTHSMKRIRSSSFDLDSSSSKKRKADKPKKQSGTTETIVPKKPKNLFMMNCYDYPSKEEEEDSEESASEEESEDSPDEETNTSLRSARLTEDDLSDGLKLLILQDGRFWPAWLHPTQLPDVYGIVMEKQRGNRPQILPRDDILREAIFEVKPENKSQLPIGTRVCVYWSRAYNCLFPGTIEYLDDVVINKENMVQVLLDDGDRRQVEISNVRMLPQDYSHVDYDPDPIASLRKRRISADSVDSKHETMHSLMSPSLKMSSSPSKKLLLPNAEPSKHKHKKKRKHHHCKRKHKKQKTTHSDDQEDDSNLKIKLDGSFNNTTTYSIRSPMYHQKSEESDHEDDYDTSDDTDSEPDNAAGNHEETKLKNRGINPVTGRPLWHWADEGYRRPGSKGKAKKLFHRSIARGENNDETVNVGDCAVFLSTARVDRPYIGQVELLWETWNGNMMVKVKWFYHPEEIETTGGTVDLRVPGGLFQSPHTDENDVQTISHKCSVLPLKEYSRLMISDPAKRKKIYSSSDTYYLAGSYDPTAMTVNFQPGVLRH